jgi:serine/threonine-protein kinase
VIGETIGHFRVTGRLGGGGMGVVCSAEDLRLGRTVALKLLPDSVAGDARMLERFHREARAASSLNHSNICTIYESGEDGGRVFLAMELVEGETLRARVAGRPLATESLLDIALQVAEALAAAHARGIVHRDVKPANVMYEPESDTVKVTDFGIARITDSSKTKTGMVLGTPSYMSPEQLAGKKIDGRSDLFSLAVSLYQLLCGHLPFDGESMAQLMFKIANEPAPDILQYNPRLPPALVAILDRAMAKEVEARFQTGEELAQALRACLGTQRPQVDITI